MAEQQLTAQQRATLFGQATRQNLQMLPKQSATSGATSLQVTFPKARLLSKVLVAFSCTVNVKHASETTLAAPTFAPYQLIRRISLDLNNGFAPFVIGGKELAMYNMIRLNPDVVIPQATKSRGMVYMPAITASSGGTDNTFHFMVELPITLNPRDPVGLILLQNESTQVTLTCDLVNGAEIFNSPAGYTIAISSVTMDTTTETFSLPAIPQAYPDLSVIKLVSSRSESIAGSGQNIVKLNCGTMYRKLILYIQKTDGTAFADTDITSNLELVFNQADIPYSIAPASLAYKNESDLGYTLPAGMYVFDFTNQGIPNLGGSRDLIDTEKLTEFWVRFSSTLAGKVTVITETLARLK